MTKLLALASLLILTLTTVPADAYCKEVHGLAPGIASPSGFDLPADGGIVVGAFGADVPLPTGDPAIQKTWRIRTAKGREAPKMHTIAPGLVVYRSTARSGRIDLEDTKGESIAFVKATRESLPRLAAPDIKYAVLAANGTRIEVEVADEAPAEAIALVLTDKQGTPRSWSLVQRNSTHQQAYAQNKCQVVPNGTVLSQIGDEVKVFWVDRAGRVSPASAAVTLRANPAPNTPLVP